MIKLRPFEHDDIAQYRTWVNDPDIMRLVGRVVTVTEDEHEDWYKSITTDDRAVIFAVRDNEMYRGNVWLWDVDLVNRRAEVRILLGNNNKPGKGTGTEAIRLITEFSFKQLGMKRLYAYVFEYNGRSKRAFEKAGYVVEGILKYDKFIDGEYHDVYLMARYNDGGKGQ